MANVKYKKSAAVRELEAMATAEAKAKHPGNPYVIDRTFRDDTANSLTDCIVKYITLKGGFASRISNQGTFNRKLNKYIPSTSKRGLADIMGTYRGLSLHIEVKIKNDKLSEFQKTVESEVIRSGGRYFIAKDFSSFKQWFDSL